MRPRDPDGPASGRATWSLPRKAQPSLPRKAQPFPRPIMRSAIPVPRACLLLSSRCPALSCKPARPGSQGGAPHVLCENLWETLDASPTTGVAVDRANKEGGHRHAGAPSEAIAELGGRDG